MPGWDETIVSPMEPPADVAGLDARAACAGDLDIRAGYAIQECPIKLPLPLISTSERSSPFLIMQASKAPKTDHMGFSGGTIKK